MLFAPRPARARRPILGPGLLVASLLCACSDDPDQPVPPSQPDEPAPVLVEFPRRLLGQEMLFGGAIVSVSARDDRQLGGLKLSRLDPINVEPRNAVIDGQPAVSFDCLVYCSDLADDTLFTAPVVGQSPTGDDDVVDIAVLRTLIGTVFDWEFPQSDATAGTAITHVEWDRDTLIVDSLTEIDEPRLGGTIEFGARWYLKPASDLVGEFTPRLNPERPLFFEVARGSVPYAQRPATSTGPLHILVQDVPDQFQPAFADAFGDWNAVFQRLLGAPMFTFEFVTGENALAGDVRVNVLQWDLENLAPYGGSAITYANQRSGRVFSGTVLVQGPTITSLYSAWFDAAHNAATARTEAERLDARRALAHVEARAARLRTSAGDPPVQLAFAGRPLRVPGAQEQEPLFFSRPPEGETYDSYMYGFFRSLAAHELGHILGLRHNFAGSLADDGEAVSTSSTMEYTSRQRRHVGRVGPYDEMAVRVAHLGEPLAEDVVFCTHGELASEGKQNSAECSADDGGVDPFGTFRDTVNEVLDAVIGRDAPGQLPAWTYPDIVEPFWAASEGMLHYAASAEATSDTWLRFWADPSRPRDPEAIRAYVIETLVSAMCSSSIVDHLESSYALNPDAAIAGAAAWTMLTDDIAYSLARLELDAQLCTPSDLLSFPF